jgi:SAM-dependent methyltransferase
MDAAAEPSTGKAAEGRADPRTLLSSRGGLGDNARAMPTADPRPTERFTDRVETYVKYRPSYPLEAMRAIRSALGVEPPAAVADVGAGTGIFSSLLLAEGFGVIAVEPNRAMREAAAKALSGHARFSILPGTAEATGLADASVSLVTAAQAFHWFDGPRARAEIRRISRAPHPVALLWNKRGVDETPFLRAYEELLLRVSDDYGRVRHENVRGAGIAAFFAPNPHEHLCFPSTHALGEEAFVGRALSASYVPAKGHPRHDEAVLGLRALFAEHQRQGVVELVYDTELYMGRLADA